MIGVSTMMDLSACLWRECGCAPGSSASSGLLLIDGPGSGSSMVVFFALFLLLRFSAESSLMLTALSGTRPGFASSVKPLPWVSLMRLRIAWDLPR
jgi:hypothetical protein